MIIAVFYTQYCRNLLEHSNLLLNHWNVLHVGVNNYIFHPCRQLNATFGLLLIDLKSLDVCPRWITGHKATIVATPNEKGLYIFISMSIWRYPGNCRNTAYYVILLEWIELNSLSSTSSRHRSQAAKTERLRKSFYPQAVRHLNGTD
jgi:hypothetical protein